MTRKRAAERLAEKLSAYRKRQLELANARREYRTSEVDFLKSYGGRALKAALRGGGAS